MNQNDVSQKLEEAMLAWHMPYASLPGSTLCEEGDCTWYTSAIGFAGYGGVFRHRFAEEGLAARIGELRTVASSSDDRTVWTITAQSRPLDLGRFLVGAGGRHIFTIRGMARPLPISGELELPDDVEVRAAEDEADVETYARIYPELTGLETEAWIKDVVAAELAIFRSGRDVFHRWIATVDGEAAAVGMTSVVDGAAVIQTLSVLPGFQKRGIGRALMASALAAEHKGGCTEALVWSGPDAHGFYGSLGFEHCCDGDLYSLPADGGP